MLLANYINRIHVLQFRTLQWQVVRLHVTFSSLKAVCSGLVDELKRQKAWKPGLSTAASIYHR